MLADVVGVPAHEVGDVAADQAVAHQLARVDDEVLAVAALVRGKVVVPAAQRQHAERDMA